MDRFVYTIEGLNVWVGRAFGWCILILTLSVSYEVFVRYVLNAPTVWSMDMMIQMYGALFLMAGPYALAQDAHVRGDFLYRLLKPKTQAKIDFVLYVLSSSRECSHCSGSVQKLLPTAGDIRKSVGTAPRESRFTFSKHSSQSLAFC